MDTEITVLMPVYNGQKYLREAIESVLNQSYSDFEFLIINDGSTDSSEAIINSYTDKRIKLINQVNAGVSGALNTGLKHASGKYIARIDADDICFPKRLEIQYHFMIQNPEYILIGSDANLIDEDGEFIVRFRSPVYKHEDIENSIKKLCPFIHSTVFFVKAHAIHLGGYNNYAHSFEDHLLWSLFIKTGRVCIINQILVEYRFNPSSVTIDERDMDDTFLKLKFNTLLSGEISQYEGTRLLESIKKLDAHKKLSSYSRMLGKKYLWDNYNPKKARYHIKKAIVLEPYNLTSYLLFSMSFLSKGIIKTIYNALKK